MLDDHGSTPLHIACWSNPPTEIIRGLLDAHPSAVSDKDRHGDTPLHVALTGPCPTTEIVKLLLDSCPMVTSIANREGLLPLHQACRYCPERQDILKIVVDAYPFALRTHIKVCSSQLPEFFVYFYFSSFCLTKYCLIGVIFCRLVRLLLRKEAIRVMRIPLFMRWWMEQHGLECQRRN